MKRWKLLQRDDMGGRDVDDLISGASERLQSVLAGHRDRFRDTARRMLDGNLPDHGDADKDLVLGIADQGPREIGKIGMVGEGPQSDMRVEQKPHPPFWVGAGSRGSITKVAERGYNLLLDQFAPFEATGERLAWFKQEVEARGRVFDPMEVGVARAFYVAKDAADKQAALERRLAAQQRQHALAQTPTGDNKASIMSFADTTGANEDSALYGTPDEICRKIEALEKLCRELA